MALSAVHPAMNLEEKNLHPFFSRPSGDRLHEQFTAAEATTEESHDSHDFASEESQAVKRRNRQSKPTKSLTEKALSGNAIKGQSSLDYFTRRPIPTMENDAPSVRDDGAAGLSKYADQDGPRKRRKTQSPPSTSMSTREFSGSENGMNWFEQLRNGAAQPSAQEQDSLEVRDVEQIVPKEVQPLGDSGEQAQLDPLSDDVNTSDKQIEQSISATLDNKVSGVPKKQIKVTKSGRLISNPPASQELVSSPRKRRGRKPKKTIVPATVTIIKYGIDTASRSVIGTKIDDILSSERTTRKRSKADKSTPIKSAASLKTTHPFFTGKKGPKKDEEESQKKAAQRPPTPRKSAVTPGKLWAETRRDMSYGDIPAFGTATGKSRVAKQLSGIAAPWPAKNAVHTRDLDSAAIKQTESVDKAPCLVLRPRKAKTNALIIPESASIINRATSMVSQLRQTLSSSSPSFEAPKGVRLPKRLLTNGVEIQRRVRSQLSCSMPTPNGRLQGHPKLHPAISTLYNDIEHTLTPFDTGRCDTQAWCQKYSPKSIDTVLQTEKDAAVLRDWLQSLTVMAVGGLDSTITSSDAKKPPKKKRKKAVEDFIVYDDEENFESDEEMVEINDDVHPSSPVARSVRRPRWTRNKNVILISGPHGCGKSATIHAVAKELDFEIFEIHSGMRRSGKDIQDKVGDMTANHLVNHKRTESKPKVYVVENTDSDAERIEVNLQKDITSGRQGTMTSFLNPVDAAKKKAKPVVQVKEPKESKSAPTSATQVILPLLSAPRKSQKQSLILFDEADILFEEDQQFWAQVVKLAAQSKRPIIITCNDERQIPISDLPLAAILRLQPPPLDLAVDYMLVLTGREGHILSRQAISELYRAKTYDIRASITELNLWCQMSVGDGKGGLEWMYQRWPPGKDVDEHGHLLRVASEETYRSGMGWLSHDMFETDADESFDREEELLKEVWRDWHIAPDEWFGPQSFPPDHHSESTSTPPPTPKTNLEVLITLSFLADSRSAIDIFSRIGLPTNTTHLVEPADPTLPPMPIKERSNYTLAAPLLQTDHQADYLDFHTSLAVASHSLISRISTTLPYHSHSSPTPSIPSTFNESSCPPKILHHLSPSSPPSLPLNRTHFSTAFDPLALSPHTPNPDYTTTYPLLLSSFDRHFSLITLDLAPYVRSIVAWEMERDAERARIDTLLYREGDSGASWTGGGLAGASGVGGKRGRTTRAARTAMEGGVREGKRRDVWFEGLSGEWVMRTAGGWGGMGWRGEADEAERSSRSAESGAGQGGVMEAVENGGKRWRYRRKMECN